MCSGYTCQIARELSLYMFYVMFQVVQADSGAYLCYLPRYENGYASYCPVVPGVITGVDGQYVSKEPYYSTVIPVQDPNAPGIFAQPISYGSEFVPAYSWDPSFVFLDGVQGHPVGVHQTNYPTRLSHPFFKAKTRCSSYVCPGSSCHTYGQNVSTEYQCLYYNVSCYNNLL
jgi:hypothetical protein